MKEMAYICFFVFGLMEAICSSDMDFKERGF